MLSFAYSTASLTSSIGAEVSLAICSSKVSSLALASCNASSIVTCPSRILKSSFLLWFFLVFLISFAVEHFSVDKVNSYSNLPLILFLCSNSRLVSFNSFQTLLKAVSP